MAKNEYWTIIDKKGRLIREGGELFIHTTKKGAGMVLWENGEQIVKVRIEIIGTSKKAKND